MPAKKKATKSKKKPTANKKVNRVTVNKKSVVIQEEKSNG